MRSSKSGGIALLAGLGYFHCLFFRAQQQVTGSVKGPDGGPSSGSIRRSSEYEDEDYCRCTVEQGWTVPRREAAGGAV